MGNNALPKVNMTRLGNAKSIGFFVELGIYLTLVCNFFILWGNSQDISLFVSWPTRLMVTYIFVLALALFLHNTTNRKATAIDAWFVALALYSAVCFAIRMAPGQLVSYMCFAMLPACIALYRRTENIRRVKKIVYLANCVYALLFLWLSTKPNSHDFMGEYGIEVLDELTLGFANTNETGIYLMLSFFIMLSSVFFWKKWWQKAGALILSASLWELMRQTDCRIAIVLATVAAVVVFLQRIFKLGGITRRIVLLLPAIMFVATMLFPETVDSLSLMGEDLDTGRYGLYQVFFSRFDISGILVGNVPGFAGGNLHNSYLSVVAGYGVITTVLYVILLGVALREQQENAKKSEAAYAAYIGILCVIAHGIAEGTLLIAGTVYAGLAGLLFLLTMPDEEGDETL